ncbi:MAG: hypothetical protein ACPG8W_20080 [Candidatus Promineifilaceae bacterium]
MLVKEQASKHARLKSKPTLQKFDDPSSDIVAKESRYPVSLAQRAALNANSLHPRDALQLQRAFGNRAVGQLLTQTPIQREVKKSSAGWGKTAGKWITTLAPSQGYDTKEEAQAAENKIMSDKAQAQEDAWQAEADKQAWVFKDGSGRLTEHFNDGWGDTYGITSYDDLRWHIDQTVSQDDESVGDKVIDLGDNLHADEHVKRPCSIRYDVTELITVTVGPITRQVFKREVYHCGPANN